MKFKFKLLCDAYARSTGEPCKALALANGKCKCHGGLSTGPRSIEGRKAIGEALRLRMASGQQERALAGFYRWLDAGGRTALSVRARVRSR
jgi:hypothetical protein